jgi:hypothetical protein
MLLIKKRKARHTMYSYTTGREWRKKMMIIKKTRRAHKSEISCKHERKVVDKLEIWSVMHVTLVAFPIRKTEIVLLTK